MGLHNHVSPRFYVFVKGAVIQIGQRFPLASGPFFCSGHWSVLPWLLSRHRNITTTPIGLRINRTHLFAEYFFRKRCTCWRKPGRIIYPNDMEGPVYKATDEPAAQNPPITQQTKPIGRDIPNRASLIPGRPACRLNIFPRSCSPNH